MVSASTLSRWEVDDNRAVLQPYVLSSVRSGSVFGKAVAKFRWNSLLDQVAEEARQWCRNGDQHPQEGREGHARNGDSLKRDSDCMSLVQADVNGKDMCDEFYPMNYHCGQQERKNRKRTHADEQDVDGPGDALSMAAVVALREMLVVVRSHCRRQSRDIVPPTREYVPNHLIGAVAGMNSVVRGEG